MAVAVVVCDCCCCCCCCGGGGGDTDGIVVVTCTVMRRISARREHLAGLKRDGRLTMCPLACGHRCRADAIDQHIRFHCRRRPVKCMYCPVIVKEEMLVDVRSARDPAAPLFVSAPWLWM